MRNESRSPSRGRRHSGRQRRRSRRSESRSNSTPRSRSRRRRLSPSIVAAERSHLGGAPQAQAAPAHHNMYATLDAIQLTMIFVLQGIDVQLEF